MNIKEIQFENPFLNASGCWSSNKPKILELLESNLGGVISKSCSLKPQLGNIKPNYYFIFRQRLGHPIKKILHRV